MPVTLDFQITQQSDQHYLLSIIERGKKETLASTAFSYDVSFLKAYEIRQLDIDGNDPDGRLERINKFGASLFKTLFTESIRNVWEEYKRKSDFLVLCIRIDPAAEALEIIPWETLFDGDEYIAAGAKTGVSRLPLDVDPRDTLPPIPLPLKMLAFISSPIDLKADERLDVESEQEILLRATNSPAGEGKLHVELEDEAKLTILETTLEAGYHIFHYTGHGIPPEGGSGLLLEDSSGNSLVVTVHDLVASMKKGLSSLRLVTLSGCQTAKTLNVQGFRDAGRSLLRLNIPAVLAMQFSISDKGGLSLAETLYPKLASGKTLDSIVNASRRAMLLSESPFIRADAFAIVLFSTGESVLQTTAPALPPETSQYGMDYSVYLPLAQLAFGFYGRRREYREIRDGLLYKNHRAVIVFGIGGVGKTALISYTTNRLRKQFKGVYAFDCTRAALTPETILVQLHRYFQSQGNNSLEDLIHRQFPPDVAANYIGLFLSRYPLLLIFDNFETHLRPKPAPEAQSTTPRPSQVVHELADENLFMFLNTLLKTTSQGTKFLFTTRYRFDLDSNRIGTIHELPLGDLSRPEALGMMQKLPRLSKEEYGKKLQVFEMFGGHPYALVALDRHLSHRSLTDVFKDASTLNKELRKFLAIELNYARLSGESRELLNRLSVFRSPVPYSGAEWMVGQKVDIRTLLSSLVKEKGIPKEWGQLNEAQFIEMLEEAMPEVRKSDTIEQSMQELIAWGLLTPLRAGDGKVVPGGIETQPNIQFAVHSLVRDFCGSKADAELWKHHLRDAAKYYLNLAKQDRAQYKSPETIWGIVEAFELHCTAGEFEEAAGILLDADPYLDRWGFGRYLERLYMRILPHVSREMQAKVLHNSAVLMQNRCEYDKALEQYEESLNILEEIGDRAAVAKSLHQIGMIHQQRDEYEKAFEQYEQALKIAEEIGNREGVAQSLHQIGMIHQQRGEYDKALEQYEKSLKIAEEIGDRAGVAQSLHQVGNIHYLRSNYDKALEQYEKSLKILEKISDRAGVALSLHQIGMIHQQRGHYEKALEQYEKSLKIAEEIGNREGVAQSLHQIGMIHQQRGEYDKALEQYEKSLKIKEEIGNRAGAASSLHQIGMIHQQRGEYDKALEQYEKSLKIAEEIGNRAGVAKSLHQVGVIHQQRGHYDKAFEQYEKSLNIKEDIGDRAGAAITLGQLGKLYMEMKEYEESFGFLLQSLMICAELGLPGAGIVANFLKELRKAWGAEHFDKAWKEKTGEDVPEEVKE